MIIYSTFLETFTTIFIHPSNFWQADTTKINFGVQLLAENCKRKIDGHQRDRTNSARCLFVVSKPNTFPQAWLSSGAFSSLLALQFILFRRVDDIQDKTILRRGNPVAHSIYGVPSTLNAANYVKFVALEKVLGLNNTEVNIT